jgi:protein-S-isoprenylcysteine O-methyltransferase Ste14
MPSLIVWPALAMALAVTELAFARRGRRGDPDARASDLLAIGATIPALAGPVLAAIAGIAGPDSASTAVGCALAAVGLGLRVSAMRGLRGRYRLTPGSEPDAHFLVNTGAYRVVRHPGYLALVCVAAGLALVACGPLGPIAALPMLGAAIVRITGEERILAAEFGERYARYRERVVWRLVPWLY